MQPRIVPVLYSKYSPSMSLEDYRKGLDRHKGTHASSPCGEYLGSFLACYLEAKVVGAGDHAMSRLEADIPLIDALLMDRRKPCKIIFNNKQLHAVFEKLKNNFPLYKALLNKGYLNIRLQCDDGSTFLHSYLKTLNIDDQDAMAMAYELIEIDVSTLMVNSHAGYPIAILIDKLADNSWNITRDNQHDLLRLLALCQLETHHYILKDKEVLYLLKKCFELLSTIEDPFKAGVCFDAILAAASLGVPLHQPLHGCLDNQTSLFAYMMELDPNYQWGIERLRRLMQMVGRGVLNVEVKTNAQAVVYEKLSLSHPEDLNSYCYIHDFAPEEKEALQEHQIVPQAGIQKRYGGCWVPDLAVASRVYKIESIVAVWRGKIEIDGIGLQGNRQSPLPKFSVPLMHVNDTHLTSNHSYRQQVVYYLSGYDRLYKDGTVLSKYRVEYYHPEHSDSHYYRLRKLNRSFEYENSLKTLSPHNGPGRILYAAKQMLDDVCVNHKFVQADNYYYAYSLTPRPVVRKNALLAYLEKGGDVTGDADTIPYLYFRERHEFVCKGRLHPRLVRFLPGQVRLSAVYHCNKTGETLLASNTMPENIKRIRVYDPALLKQFRQLGFDFSVPEVTAWISQRLMNHRLSPSLYEILACLKECGAIFPEKINEQNYLDFMTAKLQEVDYKKWRKQFHRIIKNPMEKASLDKHFFALGVNANVPLRKIAKNYGVRFEEKCLDLIKAMDNYPLLFEEWLAALDYKIIEGHPVLFGDCSAVMACLDAYVASGEYQRETIEHANDYFNFFVSLIQERVALLSDAIDRAMNYASPRDSVLLTLIKKDSRDRAVGSEAAKLKAKIEEIKKASPNNHETRMLVMEAYLMLNDTISKKIESNAMKSKNLSNCLIAYSNGAMFRNRELSIQSLLMRDSMTALMPERFRARWLPLLNTDMGQVLQSTVPPSAPEQMTYGEVVQDREGLWLFDVPPQEAPLGVSAVPSAPPMDETTPLLVSRANEAYRGMRS